MEQATILLLDCHPGSNLGDTLQRILQSCLRFGSKLQRESIAGCDSAFCDSELSDIITRCSPDVIFLLLSPKLLEQSPALFQALKRASTEPPILVVTEADAPDEMWALLKLGAADFITPPLKAIDVLPRIWRLLERTRRDERVPQTLKEKLGLKQLLGKSPVFLAEIHKIPLIAKCNASVLITGETGTGKELCARAIHYLSLRASKPFIPVNCGAIPIELVENELFGHERGAFTGAVAVQPGLIPEADGGTVLLDEIDCLPPLAQVKLLRFLQEKEYRPLGASKIRQADVRVIAATNVDVEVAVHTGKLRRDLYYRLNVIPLRLPPLRERPQDIPLLARYFLAKHAAMLDKPELDFSSEAMQALIRYEWPGNVRELEHVVERAAVLCGHTVIRKADIVLPCAGDAACQESFQVAKTKVVAQFERSYIQGLLLNYQGNITKAAQAAQKNRRAFWQLMRKHQIDAQSFRCGAS